jgi:hypothetical protein
MSVGVEGVPFDVEDAREFGERTRRYQHPTALAGAASLAAQLEERVEQGGGDLLPLTNEEKIAASAVLGEWRQSSGRPDAVDTLYRLLAPGPE